MTLSLPGLDPCVHCGFCLPACPTYEVTADENDSPRGRIVLMRALQRAELPAHDERLALHLDRCLGCRGCESVCPSGVQYGQALETAREHLARSRGIPLATRIGLWILAVPWRQRWLWSFARLLRRTGLPRLIARGAGTSAPLVARMMAMLAATEPAKEGGRAVRRSETTTTADARGLPTDRPTAVLLTGCVMDGLFSHVHRATEVVLAHNGYAVQRVRGQVCCGALAAHAGDLDLAKDLARRNVRAFAAVPDAEIVVNSAGCGALMKSYGELLAGDPLEGQARAVAARVRDVSEVLAEAGPARGTRGIAARVAYDAPCHLLHAQKVVAVPLAVLDAVPGLVRAPLEGADRCCGGAGIYTLLEPELSDDVLGRKLEAIRASGAAVVATGNPGCLMQIGAGLVLAGSATPVRHPVELLADSYEA